MSATDVDAQGVRDTSPHVKSGKCIFPFKYKGKVYKDCFRTKRGRICATTLGNNRTLRTYAYCRKKTLKIPKRLKNIRIEAKAMEDKEEKWTLFPLKGSKSRIKGNRKVKSEKIEPKIQKTLGRKTKLAVKRTKRSQKIEPKTQKSKKADTMQKKMSAKKTITLKRSGKVKVATKKRVLNQEFIKLLGKLKDLMTRKGAPFRARAYQSAMEAVMLYPGPITDPEQLKGRRAIGSTILKKFKEYVETGTLRVLERAKGNPAYMFAKVYGIGPKKAKQLVEKDGITTMEQLKARQDEVLNTVQKKGLKYFDDIEERIPRAEIDKYREIMQKVFDKLPFQNSRFEIVGSYRRGASNSGDIDIIVTNDQDDRGVFEAFLKALQKKGIILELLSKGKIKSLTIGRLGPKHTARRIDFMYSSPKDYAFAILYFTGSKPFNVVMRQRAIDMGYTMNEHNLYKLVGKKKGPELNILLPTERAIFDFLGLVYKAPNERVDGRAVQLKGTAEPMKEEGIVVRAHRKIVKKGKIKLKKKKIRTVTPKKALKATPGRKGADVTKLLKALGSEGVKVIEPLSERKLSAMLRHASAAYYHKKPVVTDEVFDILKEFIEKKFPDNLAVKEVGAPVDKEQKKVMLPYYLGSMDKIKPDTAALAKWKKKYAGPYVLSGKGDGISVLFTTEGETAEAKEGIYGKLYTRGGATEGVDISRLIPYLQLPKIPGIAIRGELMIARKTFEREYEGEGKGEYKSARNFVAGIARAHFAPEKWEDLDVVAYEVIKPVLKPSAQMKWLEDHGVITIVHRTVKSVTNELLSEILLDWRQNYKYEVDGVIVANDKIYPRQRKNPKHAFAFKMVLSDQAAEAKVVDVLWTPSKDGYLKPVVQIEKVRLRGADIEFATAYNAKFIEDNSIGIGTVIKLIRSGDVIPKIEEVIKPSPQPKMPDVPWKWNATRVDAVLKNVKGSRAVKARNIEYFFNKIEVDGLGPGNIRKVIKAGFDTVPKILKMSEEDLLKVRGFKKKTASRIYNGIRAALEKVKLPRLMAATNIFGRGLGRRRVDAIIKMYPDIVTSDIPAEEKVKLVAKVPGFALKTAAVFVTALPGLVEFLKETGLEWKLDQQAEDTQDKDHPLYGKKIVMTGFRDKDLAERLSAIGADVTSSVSKNTFVVLVPDVEEDTGKAEKAREVGVPLMTPQDFKEKFLS